MKRIDRIMRKLCGKTAAEQKVLSREAELRAATKEYTRRVYPMKKEKR